MKSGTNRKKLRKILASGLALFYAGWAAPMAAAYSFNELVPDVRQPVNISGGSACPVRSHQLSAAGAIALRWSTTLGTSPVTILTTDQTAAGRLNEIEQVIQQSLQAWTGVSGTTLSAATFAPLTRTSRQNACGVDGVNSICLDQGDAAFTPGVLAFTRVVTADRIGAQIGSSAASTQVGQILDADIYFNSSDSRTTFATPGQPDAQLADDDRTGLRVLYADPADTVHTGSIRGRILTANPLSLPSAPPGVTGVFGAHVVAVDATSGSVIGATIGGWSCQDPGPAQFDGSYAIERMAVGHNYLVYAEPMNGAVSPSQVSNAIASLCRNPVS